MSSDLKCWPGVRVSQYWPAESLSITFKPAELLRARQDGRGRWTVTRLSPDSWPVSKATKAQIAVTTECRHFDWRWVKKNFVQSVELNKGISAQATSSWRRNTLQVASFVCSTIFKRTPSPSSGNQNISSSFFKLPKKRFGDIFVKSPGWTFV